MVHIHLHQFHQCNLTQHWTQLYSLRCQIVYKLNRACGSFMGPSTHVSAVDRTKKKKTTSFALIHIWTSWNIQMDTRDLNHQSKTTHWYHPLIWNHPKECQGLSNEIYHKEIYYFSLGSLWCTESSSIWWKQLWREVDSNPHWHLPQHHLLDWTICCTLAQPHLCYSEDHKCDYYNSFTTQIDILPKQVCAQQSIMFALKKSSTLDGCIKDHHHMVCCGDVSVAVARLWLDSDKPWGIEIELEYTTIAENKRTNSGGKRYCYNMLKSSQKIITTKRFCTLHVLHSVFGSAARAGYKKVPETSTNLSFWESVKSPSRETVIWRPSGSRPAVNKNHARIVFNSKIHQIFANAKRLVTEHNDHHIINRKTPRRTTFWMKVSSVLHFSFTYAWSQVK